MFEPGRLDSTASSVQIYKGVGQSATFEGLAPEQLRFDSGLLYACRQGKRSGADICPLISSHLLSFFSFHFHSLFLFSMLPASYIHATGQLTAAKAHLRDSRELSFKMEANQIRLSAVLRMV